MIKVTKDFLRVDTENTINVLMALATGLHKANAIAPSSIDSLRVALSEIPEGEVTSLLGYLEDQNHEFMALIKSRYGHYGIGSLMTRLSWINSLQELRITLASFGEKVLKSSPTFFNRRLQIYLGDRCIKSSLFATVINDFADQILNAEKRLGELESRLACMPRANIREFSENDTLIDQTVATQLGLNVNEHSDAASLLESDVKHFFVATVESLLDSCLEMTRQLRRNGKESKGELAFIALDSIKAEIRLISETMFPKADHISAWELRRIGLKKSLRNICHYLAEFSSQFVESLLNFENLSGASKSAYPEDIQSNLTTAMISQGHSPLAAQDSVSALVKYLSENGIKPKEVLPAELKKIDAQLSPSVLEQLQAFETEGEVVKKSADEKGENLKRYDVLMKKFHQQLTKAGVIAVALLFIVGCGVKKAPTSDLIDYQPEVKYKVEEVESKEKGQDERK